MFFLQRASARSSASLRPRPSGRDYFRAADTVSGGRNYVAETLSAKKGGPPQDGKIIYPSTEGRPPPQKNDPFLSSTRSKIYCKPSNSSTLSSTNFYTPTSHRPKLSEKSSDDGKHHQSTGLMVQRQDAFPSPAIFFKTFLQQETTSHNSPNETSINDDILAHHDSAFYDSLREGEYQLLKKQKQQIVATRAAISQETRALERTGLRFDSFEWEPRKLSKIQRKQIRADALGPLAPGVVEKFGPEELVEYVCVRVWDASLASSSNKSNFVTTAAGAENNKSSTRRRSKKNLPKKTPSFYVAKPWRSTALWTRLAARGAEICERLNVPQLCGLCCGFTRGLRELDNSCSSYFDISTIEKSESVASSDDHHLDLLLAACDEEAKKVKADTSCTSSSSSSSSIVSSAAPILDAVLERFGRLLSARLVLETSSSKWRLSHVGKLAHSANLMMSLPSSRGGAAEAALFAVLARLVVFEPPRGSQRSLLDAALEAAFERRSASFQRDVSLALLGVGRTLVYAHRRRRKKGRNEKQKVREFSDDVVGKLVPPTVSKSSPVENINSTRKSCSSSSSSSISSSTPYKNNSIIGGSPNIVETCVESAHHDEQTTSREHHDLSGWSRDEKTDTKKPPPEKNLLAAAALCWAKRATGLLGERLRELEAQQTAQQQRVGNQNRGVIFSFDAAASANREKMVEGEEVLLSQKHVERMVKGLEDILFVFGEKRRNSSCGAAGYYPLRDDHLPGKFSRRRAGDYFLQNEEKDYLHAGRPEDVVPLKTDLHAVLQGFRRFGGEQGDFITRGGASAEESGSGGTSPKKRNFWHSSAVFASSLLDCKIFPGHAEFFGSGTIDFVVSHSDMHDQHNRSSHLGNARTLRARLHRGCTHFLVRASPSSGLHPMARGSWLSLRPGILTVSHPARSRQSL